MSFLVPIICDKYGRKIPLYFGAFFELAGAVIGGSSVNTGQLIGSRICIGIGTALVCDSTQIPDLPGLR